jgi:hypothetical protein
MANLIAQLNNDVSTFIRSQNYMPFEHQIVIILVMCLPTLDLFSSSHYVEN